MRYHQTLRLLSCVSNTFKAPYSHINSGLMTMYSRQSSFWHVFGRWEDTREPSWNLHKPSTLELYSWNASYAAPMPWFDLIDRQSQTNQREADLLWALHVQHKHVCTCVNVNTSINLVLLWQFFITQISFLFS